MKFASWNLNGMRARLRDGTLERYLQSDAAPKIVALQETRLQSSHVPEMNALLDASPVFSSYPHRIFSCSERVRGYSGTAILSKVALDDSVACTLPRIGSEMLHETERDWDEAMDAEGRLVQARVGDLTVLCSYVPNAGEALSRLPLRRRWNLRLMEYVRQLHRHGHRLLLLGDLNVAHRRLDLAWNAVGVAGVTPAERQDHDALLALGLEDVFRVLHPTAVSYTWWSYRPGSRAKNQGWRIDYALASSDLRPRLQSIQHRRDILGSDHCPVEVEVRV